MPDKPYSLSVKVLILNEAGECLLIKRSMSSKGNPGKWDFPGGKVDAGENMEHGLLREVREETGLKISLQRILGTAESESPSKRVAYLIFEGHIKSGQLRLSSEHDDFIWVDQQSLDRIDIADQFRPFLKTHVRESKQL